MGGQTEGITMSGTMPLCVMKVSASEEPVVSAKKGHKSCSLSVQNTDVQRVTNDGIAAKAHASKRDKERLWVRLAEQARGYHDQPVCHTNICAKCSPAAGSRTESCQGLSARLWGSIHLYPILGTRIPVYCGVPWGPLQSILNTGTNRG